MFHSCICHFSVVLFGMKANKGFQHETETLLSRWSDSGCLLWCRVSWYERLFYWRGERFALLVADRLLGWISLNIISWQSIRCWDISVWTDECVDPWWHVWSWSALTAGGSSWMGHSRRLQAVIQHWMTSGWWYSVIPSHNSNTFVCVVRSKITQGESWGGGGLNTAVTSGFMTRQEVCLCTFFRPGMGTILSLDRIPPAAFC